MPGAIAGSHGLDCHRVHRFGADYWGNEHSLFCMPEKPMKLCSSLVIVCLALVAPVAAQVTGRLSGTVVDSTGAPVAGVTVNLLLSGETRPALSTLTTAEGIFSLNGIRPALYDLSIEAKSFRTETLHSVKGQPARRRFLPSSSRSGL